MNYLFIVFQMKAFTCLAIVQLNLIESGENSCAAIGMNWIFQKLKRISLYLIEIENKKYFTAIQVTSLTGHL